jgi:hypothetical protein
LRITVLWGLYGGIKQNTQKCHSLLTGSEENKKSDWKQLFREHGIIPDVVRRIPSDRAEVTLQPDGLRIETGATVSLKDLRKTPKFHWKSDPNKLYSLFVLNPDVPSRREAFEVKVVLAKFGEFIQKIIWQLIFYASRLRQETRIGVKTGETEMVV